MDKRVRKFLMFLFLLLLHLHKEENSFHRFPSTLLSELDFDHKTLQSSYIEQQFRKQKIIFCLWFCLQFGNNIRNNLLFCNTANVSFACASSTSNQIELFILAMMQANTIYRIKTVICLVF